MAVRREKERNREKETDTQTSRQTNRARRRNCAAEKDERSLDTGGWKDASFETSRREARFRGIRRFLFF